MTFGLLLKYVKLDALQFVTLSVIADDFADVISATVKPGDGALLKIVQLQNTYASCWSRCLGGRGGTSPIRSSTYVDSDVCHVVIDALISLHVRQQHEVACLRLETDLEVMRLGPQALSVHHERLSVILHENKESD